MGSKGMNDDLKNLQRIIIPNSKSDLFAMFIERNMDLLNEHGYVGMITMQSWMFLSSYEELRKRIINQETILTMAHFGPRAFDSYWWRNSFHYSFYFKKCVMSKSKGIYCRLVDMDNEAKNRSD